MSKHGGKSLWFRRPCGQRTSQAHVQVYVSREATLDADLANVVDRKLRGIDVIVRDGYEDALEVRLNRDDASRLRDALSLALDVTEEHETTTAALSTEAEQ